MIIIVSLFTLVPAPYFPFCVCMLVTQSRLTLGDPMDYSLPGSSVHGFF